MKPISFILVAHGLVLCPASWAQSPDVEWTRVYTLANTVQIAEAVLPRADGGFLVCASNASPAFSDTAEVWVFRTDSAGQILSSRTLGNAGDLTTCTAMSSCTVGGAILCGYRKLGKASADPIHPFLLRVTEDGDSAWSKTYAWPADDDAVDVKQTMDTCFVLTGSTKSFGPSALDRFCIYLMKTDSLGEPIWTKTYALSATGDQYSAAVVQTRDTGFVVVATVARQSSGTDIAVLHTSPSGDSLWCYFVQGQEDDYAFDVIETTDGDFIVAGRLGALSSNSDAVLTRLSPEGLHRWTRTYGDSTNDGARCVHQTLDGGFVLGGWYGQSFTTKADLFIVKTDTDGSLAWSKVLGGAFADDARDICQTPDRRYVVCGMQGLGSGTRIGAWMLRLATDPLVSVESLPMGAPCTASLFQNYPNPFNPATVVQYQIPEAAEVKLTVFDFLGREVAVLVNERKTPGRYEVEFDAAGVASGVYFYRLSTGEFVQVQKMIVVR